MINKANSLGGLGITHNNRGANKPVTSISWLEAAKFINWLNFSTGHMVAYKFDGDGNFQLWSSGDVGYDPNNLYRNRRARYFLPSVDEWYKAAYYDPSGVYYDYPTGSDNEPDGIDFAGDPTFDAVFLDGGANPEPNDIGNVGLFSPYGTAGQGPTMQLPRPRQVAELVGNFLGPFGRVELREGVVALAEADSLARHLTGEPVVAVDVDLDRVREPGLDPHVHQAELAVDAVVVENPLRTVSKLKPGTLLAVAKFDGAAGFLTTQHGHQPLGDPTQVIENPGSG
jgi:hypothetical protein